MGRLSVILFDTDKGYADRLAAGLKLYLPEQAVIYVFCHEKQMMECKENFQNVVFCCGTEPSVPMRERFPVSTLCFLQGEGEKGSNQDWDRVIYKYQSVRKIAAQITDSGEKKGMKLVHAIKKQKWYGVFSPCHHENAEAFAITLAQILGVSKQALLILFTEFPGIGELFDIPETAVLEQLVLQLRKEPSQTVGIQGYAFRLGETSVLCLPENPAVLYELSEDDIKNLENFIRKETEAEAVVWFFGSLFRFGLDIMKNCEQMFCLEKNDIISRCQAREFYEFLRKGYANTEKSMPETFEIPVISFSEKGEHLLCQWKSSVIGTEISKRIGDSDDG